MTKTYLVSWFKKGTGGGGNYSIEGRPERPSVAEVIMEMLEKGYSVKVSSLDREMTLGELGTPWAENYRGSGRFTGKLSTEPVYQANGDVAPSWAYVGDQTKAEFYADFEEQQHDQCHAPATADWRCLHCVAAGWIGSA